MQSQLQGGKQHLSPGIDKGLQKFSDAQNKKTPKNGNKNRLSLMQLDKIENIDVDSSTPSPSYHNLHLESKEIELKEDHASISSFNDCKVMCSRSSSLISCRDETFTQSSVFQEEEGFCNSRDHISMSPSFGDNHNQGILTNELKWPTLMENGHVYEEKSLGHSESTYIVEYSNDSLNVSNLNSESIVPPISTHDHSHQIVSIDHHSTQRDNNSYRYNSPTDIEQFHLHTTYQIEQPSPTPFSPNTSYKQREYKLYKDTPLPPPPYLTYSQITELDSASYPSCNPSSINVHSSNPEIVEDTYQNFPQRPQIDSSNLNEKGSAICFSKSDFQEIREHERPSVYATDRYYQPSTSYEYAFNSEEVASYEVLSPNYDEQECSTNLYDGHHQVAQFEDEPKDYSSRSAALREKKDHDVEQFLETITKSNSNEEIKNEVYVERQKLAQEMLSNASLEKRKKVLKENFWIIEDEPIKFPQVAEPQQKETKKKEFICDICGVILKGRNSLRGHLNLHNGIKPFECKYCSKSFTQPSTLKNHLRVHSGERPFKCTACKMSFKTQAVLNKHKNTRHSSIRGFECVACPKRFKTKSGLKGHLKTHVAGPFKCTKCDKEFKKRSSLASHVSAVHSPKLFFQCQKCPKIFQFQSFFKQHLRVHANEKDLFCHCGKGFVWKSSLAAHRRTHLFKLRCDICKKGFITAKKLNEHWKNHLNPSRNKCSKCSKEFKFPYLLKAHENKHCKSTLVCKTCGESFISKKKLQLHSKSHL